MNLKDILSNATVFDTFTGLIIQPKRKFDFIRDCVGNVKGKKVLDLGCGYGRMLESMNGYEKYVGIDYSNLYIEKAKKLFSDRDNIEFICTDLNEYVNKSDERFDIVMMVGVMHHLNNKEIDNAMKNIKKLLKEDGLFVSYDGAYTDNMNPVAKFMLKNDRGKYVRHERVWRKLMKKYWKDYSYRIRTDVLRVPYSVIIFRAKNKF